MIRSLTLALAFVAVAPALSTAVKHGDAGKTTFTVRIENVSTPTALRSSTGATAPAPNSPGLWVVHTGRRVLFAEGEPDRGAGLEAQAEDGNPASLAASVRGASGVVASGVFDTPVGDAQAGPALPGKAYQFTFEASPGQRLTLTTMFGQSNDLFYAPSEDGIPLFVDGKPIGGDITSRLLLWDAGTEVNQEPGFGPDQAPRQPAPNTGAAERAPVRRIGKTGDGFAYPSVGQVLRVTISSGQAAAKVTVVPGAQVAAAFARGAPLLEEAGYKIHASHRTGPGQVEVHTRDTDIIHVLRGQAILVTGGTVVSPRTIQAEEIRAPSVQGGVAREIREGDVIVVPNGVPHWFREVPAPIDYYVVKVRSSAGSAP